jgi:hypothetical protein
MKKCTWCGKQYADEADACAIDGHPLEAVPPAVSPSQGEAGLEEGNPIQKSTDTKAAKRPKGVWIVTTWMVFSAGLLPIAGALFMYFGLSEEERMISGSGLAVALSIALAMITSAVCAWVGFAWARFALIALAVIHYLIAHNLYSFWQSGAVPESRQMFVWTRMVRALISMSVVVLYLLLSRNAKNFFKYYRSGGPTMSCSEPGGSHT